MRNAPLAIALALSATALASAAPAAAEGTATDLYNRIKQKEDGLPPLPPESETIVLGTMSCADGAFAPASFATKEATTTTPAHYETLGDGKPHRLPGEITHTITHEVGAFARHVTIRVNVTGRGSRALSMSLFNLHASAPAGADHVDLDIGEHQGVMSPQITCGSASSAGEPRRAVVPPNAQDEITVYRDVYEATVAYGAGGAYYVEAVPIAILYQPPADHQKRSFASYTDMTSIGTDAQFSYSRSHQTTKPVSTPATETSSIASDCTKLGGALASTGNPYAIAAGVVLSIIGAGLGSATANQTVGTSSSSSGGARTRFTSGMRISTDTGAELLGPGQGDTLWYYRHAYFVWIGEPTSIHADLIGAESITSNKMSELEADAAELAGKPDTDVGSRTHLTRTTIEHLLDLDPFVAGGPGASLPSSRFVPVNTTPYDPHSTADLDLKITDAVTHGSSSSSFTTNTDQFSSGFLSFLGIGITQDKTIQSTVDLTRSFSSSQSNTKVAHVHFAADSSDNYCVEVYFDRLFGTFAFRSIAHC